MIEPENNFEGEEYINERIASLIEALGLNTSSFANKLGLKPPQVNNLLPHARRSLPGYRTTYNILSTFRQVNPEWFLLGEGEMFKEEGQTTKTTQDSEKELDYCKKLIQAKDSEIETLKELISLLKNS